MEAKNPATARTPAGPNDKHATPGTAGALAGGQVGVALGAWQSTELRLARRFPECRGLNPEQLEDIYQDTALALLRRSFQSDEHLRNALRWGIKHRALHQHRDERRRLQILHEHAPQLTDPATLASRTSRPEDAAVLDGDRVIVSEFLSELDALERRIFWLTAEGLRYRSIAPILGVDVNQARKAARSCEQKRERFQILYESGRLCGYRAQTITAIKRGEPVSAELAGRAYTHLQACAACRAQHNTSAAKLKAAFQAHAAALLPLPLLSQRLPWITRLELRARGLAARLAPHALQAPGGGVLRERAIGMLAAGGAAGKIAAGVASIAVIAGGTIGATHALQSQAKPQHRPRTPRPAQTATAGVAESGVTRPAAASSEAAEGASPQQQQSPPGAPASNAAASAAQQPSGFSYLGTTSRASEPQSAQTEEQTAAAASTSQQTDTESPAQPPEQPHREAARSEHQHGGGPFSP